MIHAAEQKRPDVVQKREEWKKFLEETDATKLVFLDESGVNIGLTRNYGRSRGKERVKDSVPFNRPVRTTIVSGIRLNGNCAIQTMDGAMNAERFKEYVEKILCPALKPGDIVVMDNLSAHKVQGIKELIEGVGAEVKYLPPYSPEFNPIELMWAKMKAYLRAWKIRIKEKLPKAVTDALSLVEETDCRGWFSHCGCVITI